MRAWRNMRQAMGGAHGPPTEVIECVLDADAGTLRYTVDGFDGGEMRSLPQGHSLRPWACVFLGASGDVITLDPYWSLDTEV